MRYTADYTHFLELRILSIFSFTLTSVVLILSMSIAKKLIIRSFLWSLFFCISFSCCLPSTSTMSCILLFKSSNITKSQWVPGERMKFLSSMSAMLCIPWFLQGTDISSTTFLRHCCCALSEEIRNGQSCVASPCSDV